MAQHQVKFPFRTGDTVADAFRAVDALNAERLAHRGWSDLVMHQADPSTKDGLHATFSTYDELRDWVARHADDKIGHLSVLWTETGRYSSSGRRISVYATNSSVAEGWLFDDDEASILGMRERLVAATGAHLADRSGRVVSADMNKASTAASPRTGWAGRVARITDHGVIAGLVVAAIIAAVAWLWRLTG